MIWVGSPENNGAPVSTDPLPVIVAGVVVPVAGSVTFSTFRWPLSLLVVLPISSAPGATRMLLQVLPVTSHPALASSLTEYVPPPATSYSTVAPPVIVWIGSPMNNGAFVLTEPL